MVVLGWAMTGRFESSSNFLMHVLYSNENAMSNLHSDIVMNPPF
jgi:hypothetical protein